MILIALVGTMSMNAQMVEIYDGDQLVSRHRVPNGGKVVFEKAPNLGTTGSATRDGEIEVNWVQLWEGGPRFAEYNVGAANNRTEDYGGYYCFGMTIDKDSNGSYYNGKRTLAGDDDTATNLWGDNWRMPTKEELEALLNNEKCTSVWTTQNGVYGWLCTGKDGTTYAANSVFLPAAGYYCVNVFSKEDYGSYWSSTLGGSDEAFCLYFGSFSQSMFNLSRNFGCSVRPVLNE